jgi:translation initiation factor 1
MAARLRLLSKSLIPKISAMKSRPTTGGLVYSTDAGRMCPTCRKPVAQCICKRAATAPPPSDGVVRVQRETKGRGGKTMTVIRGLALAPAGLDKLAKQLKSTCGSGGTAKDGVIEIQGDHCDKVMVLLLAQGHNVKRAGG